jgi:chemotaxis protein CheZ
MQFRCEPDVKTRRAKTFAVKVGGVQMPVQRKRFRIEEFRTDRTTLPEMSDAGVMPFHHEIMSELRAIREQMAKPSADGAAHESNGAHESNDTPPTNETAVIDSYRAQIEQCEKLKVELDLIHQAIIKTKQEIALLHGRSFDGNEMANVTGELGAVVGGTEEATQQILEAAEAIDEAASSITKTNSPEMQARFSQDIQERVVTIYESCNFQDLTGQRISKVMTTMRFIENHINIMMDIWGGVDAIKKHAPVVVDDRVGDARLLNGPKGPNDEGHASQNDIDALFD